MVAEFRARHPNVAVHIEPKHSALDLSRSEAEVAIRYTKTSPETAFGRRVCGFRAALYSSRQYLERMNGIPLTEHSWCIAADTANWLVPTILPSMDLVRRNTVFSSGSPQAVINAVAAGQGTMVMACNLADTDRRLVRVSENLQHLNMDVWVLTHADLRRTARIRALMAHLCEGLHAKRAEFNGDVRAGGTELLF